jgi:hypothetical protein
VGAGGGGASRCESRWSEGSIDSRELLSGYYISTLSPHLTEVTEGRGPVESKWQREAMRQKVEILEMQLQRAHLEKARDTKDMDEMQEEMRRKEKSITLLQDRVKRAADHHQHLLSFQVEALTMRKQLSEEHAAHTALKEQFVEQTARVGSLQAEVDELKQAWVREMQQRRIYEMRTAREAKERTDREAQRQRETEEKIVLESALLQAALSEDRDQTVWEEGDEGEEGMGMDEEQWEKGEEEEERKEEGGGEADGGGLGGACCEKGVGSGSDRRWEGGVCVSGAVPRVAGAVPKLKLSGLKASLELTTCTSAPTPTLETFAQVHTNTCTSAPTPRSNQLPPVMSAPTPRTNLSQQPLTTARTPRNPSAPLLSARMALKNSSPLKILISREVKDVVTVTSRSFVAWTLCLHTSAARTAQMVARRRQRGAKRIRRAFDAWAALVAADSCRLRQGWSAQARAVRLLVHLLAQVEDLKQECFHEWQRTLKRGAGCARARGRGEAISDSAQSTVKMKGPLEQEANPRMDVPQQMKALLTSVPKKEACIRCREVDGSCCASPYGFVTHTSNDGGEASFDIGMARVRGARDVGLWFNAPIHSSGASPYGGMASSKGGMTGPWEEGGGDQDSDALARDWHCATNGCTPQPLTVARDRDTGQDVDPEFSDVSSRVSSTSAEGRSVGWIAGCEGDVKFRNGGDTGGVARVVAGMGAGFWVWLSVMLAAVSVHYLKRARVRIRRQVSIRKGWWCGGGGGGGGGAGGGVWQLYWLGGGES